MLLSKGLAGSRWYPRQLFTNARLCGNAISLDPKREDFRALFVALILGVLPLDVRAQGAEPPEPSCEDERFNAEKVSRFCQGTPFADSWKDHERNGDAVGLAEAAQVAVLKTFYVLPGDDAEKKPLYHCAWTMAERARALADHSDIDETKQSFVLAQTAHTLGRYVAVLQQDVQRRCAGHIRGILEEAAERDAANWRAHLGLAKFQAYTLAITRERAGRSIGWIVSRFFGATPDGARGYLNEADLHAPTAGSFATQFHLEAAETLLILAHGRDDEDASRDRAVAKVHLTSAQRANLGVTERRAIHDALDQQIACRLTQVDRPELLSISNRKCRHGDRRDGSGDG